MNNALPPLTALRSFESAARHLSFKNAAKELHVTPAAVSQQIRALEDFVGQPLFRRLTRALELTEAGAEAAPILQEAFDLIERAAATMREVPDKRLIVVSVAPSFGAKWLVPRLHRFQALHPEFDLRIDATDNNANFTTDGVDIGIRFGRGVYRNLRSTLILKETVFPVCSPALLNGAHPIRSPQDLAHHPLIHVQWNNLSDAAPSWHMWLKAMGVVGVDADRGPRFTIDDMTVQAAVQGQGVALASATLVTAELESGRLVRLFPGTTFAAPELAYYMVLPEAKMAEPRIRAFHDWVLQEVARDAIGDGSKPQTR